MSNISFDENRSNLESGVTSLEQTEDNQILADIVNVNETGVGKVLAHEANLQESGVLSLKAQTANLENSVTAVFLADHAIINDSQSGLVVGDAIELNNSRAGVIVAREASGGPYHTTILLAGRVDGLVETQVDTPRAILIGITAGLGLGLIYLIQRLIFGRK